MRIHSSFACQHIIIRKTGIDVDSYECICFIFTATTVETSLTDKVKKAPKRKRTIEDSGETAKRRSARVRNTKCKKEEKVDFQELLFKYLPSRLRKFDPDDDESLSNLDAQCEAKEDIQPLHGNCLPVDSVEYMLSGM